MKRGEPSPLPQVRGQEQAVLLVRGQPLEVADSRMAAGGRAEGRNGCSSSSSSFHRSWVASLLESPQGGQGQGGTGSSTGTTHLEEMRRRAPSTAQPRPRGPCEMDSHDEINSPPIVERTCAPAALRASHSAGRAQGQRKERGGRVQQPLERLLSPLPPLPAPLLSSPPTLTNTTSDSRRDVPLSSPLPPP